MNASPEYVLRTAIQADPRMAPGHRQAPSCLMASGRPRFLDPELAALARQRGSRVAWLKGWQRFGTSVAAHVAGDFAVAIRTEDGRTYLAIDRFAIRSLCYRIRNGEILFSERADAIVERNAEIDPQALLDYLYFHAIPAPRTIFKDVARVPPGHYILFGKGRLTVSPWWTPEFEEHSLEQFPALRVEFRQLLREAVQAQLGEEKVGCFLSGGTDSSTVAGMLGEITNSPPHTFSIGFDADGYDEMDYARITARHFGTIHHEYYLTPEDLVHSIPELAASYDQPFGNSSALPAYWCARLAAENGIDRLLAGDGGDELFGGNTRYARQRLLGLYDGIPGFIRRGVVEPMLLGKESHGGSVGMRKLRSYVSQARIAMPGRMQIDNLLGRVGMAEVLTPEFLAAVDQEEPLRQQRRIYLTCQAQAQINRMLAFDWKYTLADNDLPKVVGASTLAGVEVGFPLLDDRIVDFSLRLSPSFKLRGFQLRWFFKEALRGFLPDETLSKKKHGFGLPFGVWLTRHSGLRTLSMQSLDALRGRGVVRDSFIDRLLGELLPVHPAYYGELVWILMMLAQWLESPRRVSAGVEPGNPADSGPAPGERQRAPPAME